MPKKLYIGNLSYEITDDELHQIFSQCGQVSSAKVIRHQDSGKSKGFGFVEMPNDDEATHAVDRMNGFDLKGRPLVVDIARELDRAVNPRGGFKEGSSRGRTGQRQHGGQRGRH
ncbi:RNA-binding protein [bacterium]|nr:RNA-binding protein [bacterium]